MKLGSTISIIGVLGGIWVMLAPYIIGYGPKHGNPWTGIVLGSDILGALITVLSLVGVIAFWGLKLRDLSQKISTAAPEK